MEKSQEEIRRELYNITNGEIFGDRPLNPQLDLQCKEIKKLGVEIIPGPYPWENLNINNIANVNCFAYALGLGKSIIYHRTAHSDFMRNPFSPEKCKYFASSAFIKFLIEKVYLLNIEYPSKKDCIAIYFDNEKPTHAALWKSTKKLESKWGRLNAIFHHEPWRVPIDYGNIEQIKYYASIMSEDSEKYFLEYCS